MDARAASVANEISTIIFHNRVHLRGLQRNFNMFVSNASTRGYYLVTGVLDQLETAFGELRAHADALETTPDFLHDWLKRTMRMCMFVPDTGDQTYPENFNDATDVFIHMFVAYEWNLASEGWFQNTAVSEVRTSDQLPDGYVSMQDTFLPTGFADRMRTLVEAGVPLNILLNRASASSGESTSTPERRAMARQALARRQCAVCEREAFSLCGTCKCIRYCSPECQRADWTNHKPHCSIYAVIKRIMLEIASGE